MFGISGVAAIARLKAGIFREGVPAIIADQPAIALGVLREEARAAAAEVLESGDDWRARWEGEAFLYEGRKLSVRSPWLGLRGRHQAQNAGAACAALEALGDKRITPAAMAAGLREVSWPARLQKLKPGPLIGDAAVWIDAAHNPGGAATLAAAIKASRQAGEGVAIVFAAQAVKDIEGVLAELVSVADEIIVCPLPDSGGQEGGPGADPNHVAGIARTLGANVTVGASLEQAVASGIARAENVYICGSVYLCGAALVANGEQID
jgi:dihydrofolate synthase/folylpolyglutamate synthase